MLHIVYYCEICQPCKLWAALRPIRRDELKWISGMNASKCHEEMNVYFVAHWGWGGMNQTFNRQDKHSRVSKHQLVRNSVYKSANYKILLRWLDHQCKSLTGLDVSPGTPWKCITRLKPAWFELHVLLKTSKTIFFVSMFIHIHLMCTPPTHPPNLSSLS